MGSLISIITPFYNAERYVVETIQSVLNQTHENWELILINDGSTDTSVDLVKPFLIDNRIQLFEQNNQGVSAARNLGLQNMSGDFFCFLDADDVFPPHSLMSRLNMFKDTNLEAVDGVVEVTDTTLKKTIKTYKPIFEGKPMRELIRLTGSCFVGLTWLFKTKETLLPFNEKMTHSEDLLFMLQNYGNGNYSFVNDRILKYRTGHGSAMDNLQGLETGYKYVYRQVVAYNYGNSVDQKNMKHKIRRFMILAYIKQVNIIGVCRMIFW